MFAVLLLLDFQFVNAEFRCRVRSTLKLKIALKTLVNATVLNVYFHFLLSKCFLRPLVTCAYGDA